MIAKEDPTFLNKTKHEEAKHHAKIEFEKKKDEVLTSLKGLGNSILGEMKREVRNESGQLQTQP